MSIQNLKGARVSPKEFVRGILAMDLEILTHYWEERWESEAATMTKRELYAVRVQMLRYENRFLKTLGYAPNALPEDLVEDA